MIKSTLKGMKLINRIEYIQHRCVGKSVLHLGATDAPYTEEAIFEKRFLHFYLQEVAGSLIGMDFDKNMIDLLARKYDVANIMYGDIENLSDYPDKHFDVIVVGEILEHLSNPGKAIDCLSAIAQPQTEIIITVPNAYSLKGFVRALWGHEVIHQDHILHHSPYTLKSALERYGLSVQESFTFVNGGSGVLASITNHLLNLFPRLAEGVGVVCVKKVPFE